jgi:hypothetical protein
MYSLGCTQVPCFDFINCSDMRTDKNRIAPLLENNALEIMKGEQEADNVAGWTIDNPRTNITREQTCWRISAPSG